MRILEQNVLDMNFEEEITKDVLEVHGEELYKADEKDLEGDNEHLKDLARILMTLTDCMDRTRETKGYPAFFEFYIPRPDKDEVDKYAIMWLKAHGERNIKHG